MRSLALASVLMWALAGPHSVAAEEALTLTFENDTFTGSDNNYTNGVALSWVSKEVADYDEKAFVSKWARLWRFLPFVLDENEGYSTYESWSLVQEMYTPNEIENPNPSPDDQPYAGILYVDSVLYARKERWAHAWELKLGVVGPSSHADDVQKAVHDLVSADKPEGWDKQLPNEPIVNVGFTTALLLAEGDAGAGAQWRIVPVGSVGVGTYFTGLGVGLYGEVGWNLVDALGGTALREGLNSASTVGVGPVHGWSVAMFGGVAGYAVAYYLPLDGTLFRDSPSVDTEPFIGMRSVGLSVRHRRFTAALSATFYTKTFETERDHTEFGTLSLSWYL